jgi:hypothetical protein
LKQVACPNVQSIMMGCVKKYIRVDEIIQLS